MVCALADALCSTGKGEARRSQALGKLCSDALLSVCISDELPSVAVQYRREDAPQVRTLRVFPGRRPRAWQVL